MFKLIALTLICSGIYIGVQYQAKIIELVGEDGIEQIEALVEQTKEVLLDKLEQMSE